MNFRFVLLILLSSLLLCLIWFRHGSFLATAEGGIPFYNLEHQYEAVRYSWAEPGLGTSTGLITASAPTYWVLGQLHKIGFPEVFLEAVVFSILLFVSGLSIFLLTKLFFPEVPDWITLLAVLFYWFNPFALVNVWNRFLLGYMVFYTLLPLCFYLYLFGLKSRKYIYALIISLVTLVFSYALSSLPFNAVLFFVFGYSSLFYFSTDNNWKSRFFYIKFFILNSVIYVFVHAWWLTQLLGFVNSSAFDLSISTFHSFDDSLSSLTAISNVLGRISEIITFSHGTFFKESSSWAHFYQIPVVHLVQFLAPVLILWAVYKKHEKREVMFLGGLFFVVIFLMKGNAIPFGEVFQEIYTSNFLLRIFRNPFEKFGFLLPLATPLVVYGALLVYKSLPVVRRNIFIVLCFFYFSVYLSWPFLSGSVFSWNTSEEPEKWVSYEVSVPQYYRELNDWLNSQPSDFRVLALPIGGEGMTYNWENGYSGVELSSILIDKPSVSNNTTVPLYNGLVNDITSSQISSDVLDYAPFINAKYILWRGDINYLDRNLPDPAFVKEKLSRWEQEGLIKKRFESGKVVLYELDNKYQWGKVYVTGNAFKSNLVDLKNAKKIDPEFPNSRIVGINSFSGTYPTGLTDNFIVRPESRYEYNTSSGLTKLTDEELVARLAYIQHLPGDKFYPIVNIKEQIVLLSSKEYKDRIFHKISNVNKRLVEIYNLKKKNYPKYLLDQTKRKYFELLSDIISNTNITDKSSPVANEVRLSLTLQYILASRIEKAFADQLKNELVRVSAIPFFELPDQSAGRYLVYVYDIENDGKYNILSENVFKDKQVFFDGKQVSESGINRGIDLKKGRHEIVLMINDKDYFTEAARYNKLVLTDDEQYFKIPLSGQVEDFQMSFEYIFKRQKIFNVFARQNISYLSRPTIFDRIEKEENFHGSKFWSREFKSLPGSESLTVSIASEKSELCRGILFLRKCDQVSSGTEVEIKNLVINKINKPELILTTSAEIKTKDHPTQVNFVKIDPTLYEVKLNKQLPTREVLVFSELFNSNWVLETKESKPAENEHILVNNYANGWIISKLGEQTFYIRFKNQKLYGLGKTISGVSIILISLVFLLVMAKKRNFKMK